MKIKKWIIEKMGGVVLNHKHYLITRLYEDDLETIPIQTIKGRMGNQIKWRIYGGDEGQELFICDLKV